MYTEVALYTKVVNVSKLVYVPKWSCTELALTWKNLQWINESVRMVNTERLKLFNYKIISFTFFVVGAYGIPRRS